VLLCSGAWVGELWEGGIAGWGPGREIEGGPGQKTQNTFLGIGVGVGERQALSSNMKIRQYGVFFMLEELGDGRGC